MDDRTQCPKCGDECDRDSVDVGVGVIHGPWGCPACGWSEDPEYDLSSGQSELRGDGSVIDQFGGCHPPNSFVARSVRALHERAESE